MGKFKVSAEKEKQLFARMEELDVREEDIEEKFIKGSGPGGQKLNKTSSCVYLLHQPTGIEVKCQQSRSQALNRFLARRELCEKVEEQIHGIQSKRQQEEEKIRRQKRRRTRRQKERVLEEKRQRSETKEQRRSINVEDESG